MRLAAFFLFFFALPAHAGVDTQLLTALGQSGFTCRPTDAGDGSYCVDAAKVYVLVPKGLGRHERNVFYAHGDTGVCGPGLSGENHLKDQMPALLRNGAVAVLPHRVPSRQMSYPLGALVKRIDDILKSASLPWAVSGHSWGGKLIPRALLAAPAVLRRVDKVLLLDVGYDVDTLLVPPWTEVLSANPRLRIRAISSTTFTKMESFTAKINAKFPGAATNKKVKGDHCPTTEYFREL